MKTLNSIHSRGKAASIGGIGVLVIAAVLLLSFAPFSFAAGTTVTVQTSASSYASQAAGGVQVPITGTVSPAPGGSGNAVTLEVTNLAGLDYVTSVPVDGATGAFSYTLVTGPTSQNWGNGTYTVTAVYSASITSQPVSGTTTFQYGSAGLTTTTTTSTSTSSSVTPTTIINNYTTSIVTTVTSVVSSATTVTSAVTSVTTISSVTTVTSGGGSSSTALIIGIVGIVIAVIAGALAAMALRKH